MAKLKDVLQYVAYGTALDIVEEGFPGYKHLFSESDLVTRERIERFEPELLEREMWQGIHAEGGRRDRLVMPLKKETK